MVVVVVATAQPLRRAYAPTYHRRNWPRLFEQVLFRMPGLRGSSGLLWKTPIGLLAIASPLPLLVASAGRLAAEIEPPLPCLLSIHYLKLEASRESSTQISRRLGL